jgi:hypothetical protein
VGWTVRSSLTLKSIPPSEELLVRLPAGRGGCCGGSREDGMPGVNCVAGVKALHARTLPWSHLTQYDQMKDSPTA